MVKKCHIGKSGDKIKLSAKRVSSLKKIANIVKTENLITLLLSAHHEIIEILEPVHTILIDSRIIWRVHY